ncbi:MaoC family dehydratase N-terminal domain-containing protein [Chloroflexota bacterium]
MKQTPEQILTKLKSFVGYETVVTDEYLIEDGMIKRFAGAIGDENPLYYDADFARRNGFPDIIAPPTFVFEWHHHEALWADENGVYIDDYPLPNRFVRAGSEYEFTRPLYPGDIITTRSKIMEVYEKTRASGEKMIFIISESTYANQDEEVLGIQRGTAIVFV